MHHHLTYPQVFSRQSVPWVGQFYYLLGKWVLVCACVFVYVCVRARVSLPLFFGGIDDFILTTDTSECVWV